MLVVERAGERSLGILVAKHLERGGGELGLPLRIGGLARGRVGVGIGGGRSGGEGGETSQGESGGGAEQQQATVDLKRFHAR